MADIRHGTYAGWNAHQKQGVLQCIPCLEAARIYQAERRKDPAKLAEQLLQNKAGEMAQRALARRYKTEYRQLYEYYKFQLQKKKTA